MILDIDNYFLYNYLKKLLYLIWMVFFNCVYELKEYLVIRFEERKMF